jgi:hypothetical protein
MSTLCSMIDGNDATFAMSTSDGVKLSQVTFTEGGIAIPNPQNLQAAAWCQHDLIVGWYPIMRGGSPPLVAIHKTQIMCHVIYGNNALCGQQTLSIIILGGSLQLIHRHDNTRDAIAEKGVPVALLASSNKTRCRAARRQVGGGACW